MTILGDRNLAEFNDDFARALADTEDQAIDIPAIVGTRLERLRVGITTSISKHLLGTDIDILIDYIASGVEVEIRGHWWSENLGKMKIEYPRDWWQAFKERWFPVWALRRWPVENECHDLDMKVLYPDFRPSLPDQSYNFAMLRASLDM